jgi:hypothetical protein
MRYHGNAWAAMVGLVEVVVVRQQSKCVCTGANHIRVTLFTDNIVSNMQQ